MKTNLEVFCFVVDFSNVNIWQKTKSAKSFNEQQSNQVGMNIVRLINYNTEYQ